MTARPEDWELLGLEPGADIARVKLAYRHRLSLYDPTSLATYNLFEDFEREAMVARIEDAYHRIVGSESPRAEKLEPAEPTTPIAKVPSGLVPDPIRNPG